VPVSQTSLAMQVMNSINASGTAANIASWAGNANQEWYVERQGDGSYKIYAFSAKNSLQMLDYGSSTGSGQPVLTQEDKAVSGVSDNSQRWWLSNVGGSFRLIPYNAGSGGTATLEVSGGADAGVGASMQVNAYSGGTNQKFTFTSISTPTVLVNAKKGLPTASGDIGDANMVAAASKMNCTWIYNWSINPPSNLPAGIEFVPEVWGWSGDTNITNEVLTANPNGKHVLGYNEPDFPFSVGGSQMDESVGITGFQYISALKAHGFTIGSPSCAVDSGTWMQTFMSQATSSTYHYNIDFIGFHNYVSDSGGAAAAYSVLGFLDYVHSLYPGYPIWVTEAGASNLSSTQEGLTFVRILCQGFQSRSFVQRYCLFTSQAPTSSGFGAYSLINTDGSLTAAGKLYARM